MSGVHHGELTPHLRMYLSSFLYRRLYYFILKNAQMTSLHLSQFQTKLDTASWEVYEISDQFSVN